MLTIEDISGNLVRALSQLITGKLLTEKQIQSISSHVVGQFVAAWLPEPKARREAKHRVDEARDHLAEATRIVSELKTEIDGQFRQLESLEGQLEEKRRKAEEYTALIQAGEPAIQAIRTELEQSVHKELEAQAKRGRGFRLAANLLAWLITLLLGSALGAHWNKVEAWVMHRDKGIEVREAPIQEPRE